MQQQFNNNIRQQKQLYKLKKNYFMCDLKYFSKNLY